MEKTMRRGGRPGAAPTKSKREILINVRPYEKRIAILEDGRISEIVYERPESNRLVGNIYKGVVNAVLADKDTVNVRSSVPMVNAAIQRAKGNPQLALYRLQDAASKFAWVLIPISVPFLWLLFPFSRRFRLYDHSVFVTYSLSFMMLLVVTLSLVGAVGLSGAAVAAVLIPPVHIYRQLKGAYSLSRLGALWRAAMLLLFAVIALALFAMTVVVLGMSG